MKRVQLMLVTIMPNEVIDDKTARESALDPRRSYVVQAPAGSGKTTLLTQRFLRLLASVAEPESIVALTFTRKAAEEMRTRILTALREVTESPATLDPTTRYWAEQALAANARNQWDLLDSPRRLRVLTIDALAATIAGHGPLASGHIGNAQVLEDADHLYQLAARAAINQLAEPSSPWAHGVRTLLRHLDNDWTRLEDHLATMLARRDQWLRFVAHRPDKGAFESALMLVITHDIEGVASLLPEQLHSALLNLCIAAGRHLARDYPDSPMAMLAELEALPPATTGALPIWQAIANLFLTNKGEIRKRVTKREGFPSKVPGADVHKQAFVDLAAELIQIPEFLGHLHALRLAPQPDYSEPQWTAIEALFSVLQLAAAELKFEFSRAGSVDFIEVAHGALAALGDADAPGDIGLILDYQIQHLLIDEFQDTSITQFEMVQRLVAGWENGDGRTLFLVGDPMQSIYRFRQAEVGLFTATFRKEAFGPVKLRALQLTKNFRAQATVVEWINSAIDEMRPDCIGAFEYAPTLIPARANTHPSAVSAIAVLSDGDLDESHHVVDIVKRTLAEHPEYSIGILVRSRAHVGSLSQALMQAGIAVAANDIERLHKQPVVGDLQALTLALLHPADRVAWLAILRAPWCGLSLRGFSALFENEDLDTIWSRLEQGFDAVDITAAECELLERFCEILKIALAAVAREPIAALVERTWQALGGPSCYPFAQLHHAAAYFELLGACERKYGLITAERLTDFLARQFVSPPSRTHAKVEIMTIHRAKGLEFDTVIVPGLNRMPRAESHRLLTWKQKIIAGKPHLLFAPIPETGAVGDVIHQYLHNAERQELTFESYRLLYVALTRARELLYLVASAKQPTQGSEFAPAARSFLKMLWPAVSDQIAFVPAHPTAKESSFGEPRQRLRRLKTAHLSRLFASESHVRTEVSSARNAVEFDWAGNVAKHVGTVIHELICKISQDGIGHWSSERLKRLIPTIENRLRVLGISNDDRFAARDRIVTAVDRVMRSERGRWIIDDCHTNAHSEYALSSIVDGYPVKAVIDRTFVEDGVRWIIDYKTGTHTGGDISAFVNSEVERYRPQLESYARLLQAQESQPIILGLYFPLLDAWREWHYVEAHSTVAL